MKSYICTIKTTQRYAMTEQDRQQQEGAIKLYKQQLHLTVIYEQSFLQKLGSQKALMIYRNDILDKMNVIRRNLGYLKT